MVPSADLDTLTACLAILAASDEFFAISRIEADISSAPEATTSTFLLTCSLAAETTPACVEVSSAFPAICWLTLLNSSEAEPS